MRPEIKILDPAQTAQLLWAAQLFFDVPGALAATTGLRRGECLGLRWGGIDLDKATASIVQTFEETDHCIDPPRAGHPSEVVQEALGHASVSITLDMYSHLIPGMQQEAAKRIDTVLRTHLERG